MIKHAIANHSLRNISGFRLALALHLKEKEKTATFGRTASPAFHVACVCPFMPNNDAVDSSALS